MKLLKFGQILVLGLGVMFFFAACGEKGHTGEHSQETHAEEGHDHEAGHDHEVGHDSDQGHAHGEGIAYTAAFVCPMHCEGSGSDEAGECPVCGMTYVAQADHVADGHSHMENKEADHDHAHGEDHDH